MSEARVPTAEISGQTCSRCAWWDSRTGEIGICQNGRPPAGDDNQSIVQRLGLFMGATLFTQSEDGCSEWNDREGSAN